MVTGVVNILLSSMSTGLREEGATVSNRVFNTPNASGESRCICEDTTNKYNETILLHAVVSMANICQCAPTYLILLCNSLS